MESEHYPVMYREVIENLSLEKRKLVVDCTTGVGALSYKMFEKMSKDSFLVGLDKDEDSLRVARARLSKYGDRFRLFQEDFRNLDRVMENLNVKNVDAFVFDLGISTYQLSNPERGFSFLNDGPLDMRMDKDAFLSAYDLVNNLSENELITIFRKYGEERFSRRIAHVVVQERKAHPISTTTELSQVVMRAVSRRGRIHPATRIFQALRIAVNRELDSLEIGLKKAIDYLSVGGRIVVISFHSLEDRIVKHTFKAIAQEGKIKIITKKPLTPSKVEVAENKASRSAKLRVAERI